VSLATALIDNGKLDSAIKTLNTALKIEPKNSQVFYKLCRAFSKKGYYTIAIGHCKQAIQLRDDFFNAMNRLAWLYAKKRSHLEEALQLSSKTLAGHPNKPEYIDTLSEIYYVKGETKLAISNIQSAIKLDPDKAYYKKQLWKFRNVKPPKPLASAVR